MNARGVDPGVFYDSVLLLPRNWIVHEYLGVAVLDGELAAASSAALARATAMLGPHGSKPEIHGFLRVSVGD